MPITSVPSRPDRSLGAAGREAAPAVPRHDAVMTTAEPNEPVQRGLPEPRDIALEMETPEQAAELEAQSEPGQVPDDGSSE